MSKASSSKKRLEALKRAQQLNEILKLGGMQSQALLDSAGESRPSDEGHVAELLESERFTRPEFSEKRKTGRKSRSRPHKKARARTRAKARPKRKKRR